MKRPPPLLRAGPEPLFERIRSAIADDIATGTLPAGERLWGSRALSQALGVSRSTVEEAYDRLLRVGLLERLPGRGTFVASRQVVDPSPLVAGFSFRQPPDARTPAPRSGSMLLSGPPEARLLPLAEVARAMRRALSRRGKAKDAHALGSKQLRTVLAEHLRSDRGLRFTPDEIMVFPRAPEAARQCLRAVVTPGEFIAACEFDHPALKGVTRSVGAGIVPFKAGAVPEDGREIAAIWVQPFMSLPTTTTLDDRQRATVLTLASRRRLAVLEADYAHWLTLEGLPPPPLAASSRSHVLYLGTVTHLLAPDIELSWVAGPASFLDGLARWRRHDGWTEDTVGIEAGVAELIDDGVLRRSLRRMVPVLAARRDALVEAVRHRLGSAVSFDVPTAGTGLWLRVDDSVDIERWADRALARGVRVRTARHFSLEGLPRPFMRLGYAAHDPPLLREGVEGLAQALQEARRETKEDRGRSLASTAPETRVRPV